MPSAQVTAPAFVGDRVFDFAIETVASWTIDTTGVVPELPHMAMRARHSSTVTTGPVAEILVQRTSGTRRRGVRITLTGGDDTQERDERITTTFASGSGRPAAYRTATLPQRFKDLINAQTGLSL